MTERQPPRHCYSDTDRDVGVSSSEKVTSPVAPEDRIARSMPATGQHDENGTLSSPASPDPRKSSTYQRTATTVRPSEEFDRRYDGPFGRPSLAMTRRRSSAQETTQGRSPPPPGEIQLQLQRRDLELGEKPTTVGSPAGGTGGGDPGYIPEPPPLNYTLRTRKLSILFFWVVIIFDSVVIPIALYFGLWYGVGPGSNTPTERREKLSANAVFSIVTAAVGGASIVEYFLRFWRLWKKESTCRVIGAHRWYLDWFHWNFSLAWIVIMIELIVGTVPHDPPIRLLSMPLATMLFTFGTELLLVDTLRYFHVPAPCRISSVPKGAQLRPGIYSLIEDICAVDGSGGTEFRVALDKRYQASHIFRAMLRRLGVFWAVGAQGMAVLCTILIFTIDADIAYTIGWSLPFVWGGVWTIATFWYVKRELKRERKEWKEEVVAAGESPERRRSSAY